MDPKLGRQALPETEVTRESSISLCALMKIFFYDENTEWWKYIMMEICSDENHSLMIFQQIIYKESTWRIPEGRKISICGVSPAWPQHGVTAPGLVPSIAPHGTVGLDEPSHCSQWLVHSLQLNKYRTGARGSGKSGKKPQKTPEGVCKQQK